MLSCDKRKGNIGLWAALVGLIYLAIQQFGVNVASGEVDIILDSIGIVLVFLGIVSDPTTVNRYYFDDK